MLNIGEFARAGGVSVRMLRHYDQRGLLTPAQVDPWSGRRHYDLSQLGKLHRIVTLKELGFTLVQVADLLAEGSRPPSCAGCCGYDVRSCWPRSTRSGIGSPSSTRDSD